MGMAGYTQQGDSELRGMDAIAGRWSCPTARGLAGTVDTMGGMRPLLILSSVLLGCTFDASGAGDGSGAGSEAAETSAGVTTNSTTTTADSGSSSTGSEASTTASSEPDTTNGTTNGTTSSTTSGTTSGTTGEPPPTAYSCQDILDADPSAPTGIHSILRTSDDAVIEVWCDMAVEGGGWTLVARTAEGPVVPFGWGVSQGTLGEEEDPYSLDAVDVELPFTQILVGAREDFATLIDHAYVMDVPVGFLEDYGTQAYQHDGAATVIGDCDPDPGPEMLRWVGYTDNEDCYFFRDNSGDDSYGLYSNRMWTLYDNCQQGGQLDDVQAALFVR